MGKNRSKLDLMCKEEAEEYMASLKEKLPRPFSIGILPNGEPFFAIPKEYIVENEDGTVSWSAREICVGLHPFIELTTGQDSCELRGLTNAAIRGIYPWPRSCSVQV